MILLMLRPFVGFGSTSFGSRVVDIDNEIRVALDDQERWPGPLWLLRLLREHCLISR